MTREVWITGACAWTPLGEGREEVAEAALAGRTAIAPARGLSSPGVRATLAAQVADPLRVPGGDPLRVRRYDRPTAMAVACATRALADAGLSGEFDAERAGLSLGTGFGGLSSAEAFHRGLVEKGPARANPMLFPMTVPNGASGQVSIELGLRGPSATFAQLGTSAEQAIAYGASCVAGGSADLMLAGGADDVGPILYGSLDRLRALSRPGRRGEGARPFDRTRNGTVSGEGAAVLVLEDAEHARRRGARPLGRLLAAWCAGASCSPTGYPRDPGVLAASFRAAGAAAGGKPPDLVLAAANGSPGLDALEAAALRAWPGEQAYVCSLSGAWGDWCSSGAARTVVLLECLRLGVVPPTLGLSDPEVPVRTVTSARRVSGARRGMVSAVSTGGTVACLLLDALSGPE